MSGFATPTAAQIEVTEASVRALQEAMTAGHVTARVVTEAYLQRIAAIDPDGRYAKAAKTASARRADEPTVSAPKRQRADFVASIAKDPMLAAAMALRSRRRAGRRPMNPS